MVQGKYILPVKVNLPCVDWPFYIALSKIVRSLKHIFLSFLKNLSGLLS